MSYSYLVFICPVHVYMTTECTIGYSFCLLYIHIVIIFLICNRINKLQMWADVNTMLSSLFMYFCISLFHIIVTAIIDWVWLFKSIFHPLILNLWGIFIHFGQVCVNVWPCFPFSTSMFCPAHKKAMLRKIIIILFHYLCGFCLFVYFYSAAQEYKSSVWICEFENILSL